MRKNNVEPGMPQMTIWRMRIACSITKATNTYSEYVILTAFPLQQWLHKRASVLRYTYTSYPVIRDMECVYCAVRTVPLNIIQVTRAASGAILVTPFIEGLLEIRGNTVP
jgi:hypothetical protein